MQDVSAAGISTAAGILSRRGSKNSKTQKGYSWTVSEYDDGTTVKQRWISINKVTR